MKKSRCSSELTVAEEDQDAAAVRSVYDRHDKKPDRNDGLGNWMKHDLLDDLRLFAA
jgi:hypothetical protein